MRLIVCNSGSDGNTYLLTSDTDCIVIDCGVNFKTVLKSLDFDISKIRFAVCSHIHNDHMGYVKEYLNRGIKVLMPSQVKDKFLKNTFAIEVCPMKKIYIDGFYVTPFEVPHDADVTCFAYIIEHKDLGKMLYMTDCMYCKYFFKKQKINHMFVECNYQQEYINKDLVNFEHKIRGHCSLDTCREFVKVNATDSLETVLLLHMGEMSCNPKECVAEIQKVVNGANVDYARAGLEVELKSKGDCPF